MLQQMRDSWNYLRSFRPFRTTLLFFSYPYALLLPVFAGQVLHGGPHTLGWLTGTSGIGALISAFSPAFRKSVIGLTRTLPIASAILGAALILFGLSRLSARRLTAACSPA